MADNRTFVVFVCNWDGLNCVESAAQNHLTIPSFIKIVRVSCLSRINTGLILHAFVNGADGVLLLGCESGNCHYSIEEHFIEQNVAKTWDIMKLLGIKQQRLELVRLKHGDGSGFVKCIHDFIKEFETLKIVKF